MVCRVELARRRGAARAVDEGSGTGRRAPPAASAIALALDAAFANAKDCVQVLGGIGFTWEHDAHVYLKRAIAMRSLLGPAHAWRVSAARSALGGVRRELTVDLGPQADDLRSDVRAFLDEVKDLEPGEQRRRVADAG